MICIRIDDDLYQERMALCKPFMIDRIIQSIGESLWKIHELCQKLDELWQVGEGYYNLHFTSQQDRDRIWAAGLWHIKPGLLHL